MDRLKRKIETEAEQTGNKFRRNVSACLNSNLVCRETVGYLRETLEKSCVGDGKLDNVEVYMEPFQLCMVKNFLNDLEFVNELRDQLLQLELITKRNDLYQYQQSADLSTVSSPAINAFKDLMKGQGRDWVKEVTGKELNNKIVMNCSAYNYTDHLLCHDDNTEDRLIAFVFYLTSDKWTELDGGQLQMFKVDSNNQPAEVVRSLMPEYNSFVFFEVTRKSFHQVAEILSADRTRLSINGWFHGTANPPSPPYQEPPPIHYKPLPMIESLPSITRFINNLYLNLPTRTSLSNHFEQESEIFLTDFLNDEPYMKIALALQSEAIKWTRRGPADRRNYLVADETSLPACIQEIVNFLKSQEMFDYLQTVTQLDLCATDCGEGTSSAAVAAPTCTVEIQRWEAGHYTLVHDDDITLKEQVLDVCLYFNAESVETYHGGFISYIARDDDEELMTVVPQGNGLAMTFRDKETLRFVKYINHRLAQDDLFHAICLTYSE